MHLLSVVTYQCTMKRNGEAIYPTPTIGMVGLVKDLSTYTTQEVKKAGDVVYVSR